MKMPPKTKNKIPSNNPYSHGVSMKLSPYKGGNQGYSNKLTTVKTAANGVFVSWSTRPDGNRTASFIKPMKDYFNEHCEDQNLMEKWNILGFFYRREYNEEEPRDNTRMPGADDANWGWDAFVSVDVGGDAADICKHIASTFSAFTGEKKGGFNGKKQNYKLIPVANNEPLYPLNRYILDDDVLEVFKRMYGHNEKASLLADDELLESFFGSAEIGRDMIHHEDLSVSN